MSTHTTGAIRAAEVIAAGMEGAGYDPGLADRIAEIIDRETGAAGLLFVCNRLARLDCEYGDGADCHMLPEGVIRSVCLPCQARAAIALATKGE